MASVQASLGAKSQKNKMVHPSNHKLVLKSDGPRKVTPSVYVQQMLQSSEERLANTNEIHPPRILELFDMSKTTHHKTSLVDLDQALFQPFPSELVFQNFSPAQTYKLELVLFNIDKVPRQVKVELQHSEYFHVVIAEEAGRKVAPGLDTTFTVYFTPQENKDYHHRLVFATERERFEVPVRAIGPRAILDFRDEVHFPVCPVKASTQRTQLVRNVGNSQAKFELHAHRPFSVTPSCGTLDVGESMQVTVDFNPTATGDHKQDLWLHYHTGEDVYISLYGACEELSVHLKPDFVLLKDTYVSLASKHTVCLSNTSDIPLHYCWTTCSSQEEENLSLSRESSVFQQEEGEMEEHLTRCEFDPAAALRLPLSSKAARERRCQASEDDVPTMSHSCITVEPMEGDIWPKITAHFDIIFKPQEAKVYQQTLYCDVTGRESRLPLILKGEGVGPRLQLNYDLVDIENVFIGSKNCYEVVVSNRGLIDGSFRLLSPNTTFGRRFSVSPEEGVVPSGACQTVEVTFHSCILGTFCEDLLLIVTGQPQPLTLTFRGCVIGPTFHFSVSELNFGNVAFGFPQTSTLTLYNTSLVPMTFSLRVLGDGLGPPSVTCATQVSELSRTQWQGFAAKSIQTQPMEFAISPASGSVRAMSNVIIKVTLCSNTVKIYRLALVVDVKDVGKEIMALPITARCVVPEILVETPVLDFQRCFLSHRYEEKIRLTNSSTLPACYGVLDQEYEERPPLLFGSSVPRGMILPHSSVEIPVFLLAKAVGRLYHALHVAVFGRMQPPLEVVLSCIGQGPVVHIQSPQLDFGRVPVLTDIIRPLLLLNQSPIPASFNAFMVRGKSPWRVEPSEGEVPPESQLELSVVAHLKDTLPFQDLLKVAIQDSQTHTVALFATGTGTTIISDRPFGPSLDLGVHFSHQLCQYHFKLTNHGQRVYRMYWQNSGPVPSTNSGRSHLPSITAPRKRDVLRRGSQVPSAREKPVFSLSPCRVEHFPGCTVDMVLMGSSDTPRVVRERLVCNGVRGHQGSYEHIMSVDVTCHFVAPVLSISTKQLNFYIEKVREKSLNLLYEKLVLKNVSSVSLSMDVSVVEPFSLCEAQGAPSSVTTKSVVLGDGRQAELWVCFNPACCQDRLSRVVDESLVVRYEGHPQQDTVELHAEVHFPNLHFSSTTVDFGCVLNCTGSQKEITVTNCSLLPVSYRWTFLVDQKECTLSRKTKAPEFPLNEEEEQANPEHELKEGGCFSKDPAPFSDEESATHVEEVFDVLPIFGHLQPGEQQFVTFSFHGQINLSREVVAQCHVEDGPIYEVKLKGEASEITYSLDSTYIDFGLQLFDHVGTAEVALKNSGKVGFKFKIIQPQWEVEEENDEARRQRKVSEEEEKQPETRQEKDDEHNEDEPEVRPGQPVVIPVTGYINAGAEQRLHVFYLPGLPEAFEKRFQVQVAFLPPQDIVLSGVGVFPRISLNLPRDLPEERYSEVVQRASAAVEVHRVREEPLSRIHSAGTDISLVSTYEELLHMETERMLVKENALAVTSTLLQLKDMPTSFRKWHKLSKFLLPEYVLDFGYVIHGKVLSRSVKITNTGSAAVSFQANHKPLAGTGFSAEFERVKNLPCGETYTFTIKLEAKGGNVQTGNTSLTMPIQVAGGPVVPVRLCAVVTVPALTVSADTLQFDTVQCGMCQVMTIQLFNHESVPCSWSVTEAVKPCKKVSKFMPAHVRKKVLQEQQPPPVVFETMPCCGALSSGDRVNVQVKFSPAEECAYSSQLVLRLTDSTHPVLITVRGQGVEPQLEFRPAELEFQPNLPFSTECEAEVTVKNPCSFPIEFYSLQFDTQYVEEEQILRLMQGYDEQNILLLPPRAPGDNLPTELLEYYEEYCSQFKADGSEFPEIKANDDVQKEVDSERLCLNSKEETQTSTSKREKLYMAVEEGGGRLEQPAMTPVSKAIARHMGVDVSPEGLAARKRRGIALVVYGAPRTALDQRSTAVDLARHYGAACLSVDAVVTDALTGGASLVSQAARRLYDRAAAEHAQKEAEEAPPAADDITAPSPAPTRTPSQQASNKVPASPNVAAETSHRGSDSKSPEETETNPSGCRLRGEVAALSQLLPEQLLVDILAERLQLSDCHRGAVIDGLESVYTQSVAKTLQVVLKAFNNRKHIHVVNVSDSYSALKARERAQKEAEEAQQKEAANRQEQWLQEMDEEEYEALPEQEKERIVRRHREQLRQRKLRNLEQMKAQEEKRHQEETRRQKENFKKKSRKIGKRDGKDLTRKKSTLDGKQSAEPLSSRRPSLCNNSKELLSDTKEQNHVNENGSKSLQNKDDEVPQATAEETKELHSAQPVDKPEREKESDRISHTLQSESSGDELESLFIGYEKSQLQVDHILKHWDRTQGLLLVPLVGEDVTEDVSTPKQTPNAKKSKKANLKNLSPMDNHTAAREAEPAKDKLSPRDPIPHIVLNVVGKDHANTTEVLTDGTLPPVDEVLDNLGLGPSGSPIPPPMRFSIVPFPQSRMESDCKLTCDCFTFLVPSKPDENGDENKQEDVQTAVVTEKKEETAAGSSRSRSKGSTEDPTASKDKDRKSRESQKGRRQTPVLAKGKKPDRSGSSLSHVSLSDISERGQQPDKLQLKRSQSLKNFRWVVPANGEVVLKIWFYSDTPGKFEQTFNFELLGTRRSYQLLCRGASTYPSVCKDYKTLFALSKTFPKMEEGLQKTYVVEPGVFEFGPLLCSKTRDRYKESKYPENSETLMIHNDSFLRAEVQFRFQYDSQATTYLLDPPKMTLEPNRNQKLTVWAYPTKLGQIEDRILCSVKDNPEFDLKIPLSCWGVRPELEVDRKQLHFDRTLLHRCDSRSVTLHNKTALPASWRLRGMEELGDEFSVPQDQGVVSPKSSFSLRLYFRPRKPLNIRKTLRLEVSDVEKILGTLHTENIHIIAEAYDVALEITPDGCLDFGNIRVFEEAKLSFKMRNQGKYEVAYRFTLESADGPSVASTFTVSPQSGSLLPNNKPTTVNLVSRSTQEISIQEQPILHCQVIEPRTGNGGETIAILTTNVSLQSSFSRYKITPSRDLNFGPLSYGCKKSHSFNIENSGIFETHFTICHMSAAPRRPGGVGSSKKTQRESAAGLHAAAPGKITDTGIPQSSQIFHPSRLNAGAFSVFPRTGMLQPGSRQVVTVDCAAEQSGSWDEVLLIDISDRDPSDCPDGIPYRLLAEVCKPGISLDMSSVFEEHHLCSSSSQLSSEQFCDASSIYLLDENKFIFNKVLVGRSAQARFKLTNNRKVPCQLSLAIRYVDTKTTRSVDVFHLPDATLCIPSQSHSFCVITFTPQTMQLYHAVFEATLEGYSGARMTPMAKGKVLEFDLLGEGTLPSVCVTRPALRDHRGSPVLQFRRVLAGRRHSLPLVLMNDGNVPVQVHLNMLDKHGVFTLKAAPSIITRTIHSAGDTTGSEHQLDHQAFCTLSVNEQAEFEVSFCSDKPLSVKAKISLYVEDNHYSSTDVQLVGEAYQEMISIENIRRSFQRLDEEEDKGGDYEVLDFGECHVNYPCQESFTITNHSSSQAVKFEWPADGPHVVFSPQVGHLHAGCSKEVTVTFCSDRPVTLTDQPARCKICEVVFQQSLDQVVDWDDRKRTVQWLSASQASGAQPENNKVVKTDSEPPCSVVEGSQCELDLRVSAVCDYVKLSCNTEAIHFKDTMLYQSRLQQLQIGNRGSVKLEYSWQVLMESGRDGAELDQSDEAFSSRAGSRSGGGLTESRPGSALASVMSLLTGNPELPPFSVEPALGTVEPGATQNFHVRFSPLEVAMFQGRLLCSIPNLQDGDQAPRLSVCGRSLLPHCHFDLEDSDYISGNRRNPEFRSHLDPNARVVEFNSVGIATPIRRCFTVLNPTNKPYSFKWRCEDTSPSPFRCLTPSGVIQAGKKVEACVEYVAEQLDVVESFWSFAVETLSLSVPFLLVGAAREPVVYFNMAHLDLGEVLLGRRIERTVELVNGEEERYHFSVLQSSLHSDDQRSSLEVQPTTGMLEPKRRVLLSVSFTPCQEGDVTFRLVLKVKKKSEPLCFTVKADCFIMSTCVQVQKPDGGFREIGPNQPDSLDFGTIGISEQSSLSLLLTNVARFNLEVTFDLSGACELIQYMEVKPQAATVKVGEQLQVSLVFYPRNMCSLQDIKLTIKVRFGPTFTLTVKGEAVSPSLEFSFTKYSFGKCIVHGPGMVPPSHILLISNKGKRDISVQCLFKSTPYLEISFRPDIVKPGAVMEVLLTFCPREACRYHEKITFTLNSCVTKSVDILGQGVEMKLEVEDPRHKKVKLGSIVLGQKVKKQVTLVNRSLVELSFTLQLSSETPLDPRELSFSPAGEQRLKANGGSCHVEIQFSPRQQISPFTAELQAQCAGLLHPLLTVQGRCQGVEVYLDRDHLAFGAVVQRCQTMRKIFMKNAGDIGARFHWKVEDFPPALSIVPVKGYICPGMEVPFEVTFAPAELNSDARYENLCCCVEGASSPVGLTVTGSCIVASTSKDVVAFVCPVRGSQSQALPVSNPTNQRWNIRPVIEGEQWKAPPSLTLEPLQTQTYNITYQPLSMTAEGKKHQGSVFFSFPDGTGMLYSLQGTAEPPKVEDTVLHEVPAKTLHTQLLSVHNWLATQQRFRVEIEILKPDKHDASVSLKGLEYIDVPAQLKKDYKMSFYAHREGQYNSKVTFHNQVSGEYMFYLLIFKVTSPGVLSTIELEATVRQTASACVTLENPLTTATCFTPECKCPDISVPPQHTVPGQSKGALSFEYQPLHTGKSSARLTLHSNELGHFHYRLLLKALPPAPEKPVHFQSPLGCSHSVLIKFKNYSRLKTEYSCKTDCPDFIVDKSVGASPGFQAGSDASVEVCFEPHQIGEARGELTLSSGSGGEYVFPLRGTCLPPKAQGPFTIRAGRNISVPFKNVFLQTAAFSFQVDSPCFTVKGVDTIPPKKTCSVQVAFDPAAGASQSQCFGKLIVSSQRSEGHSKPCSWTFYLKGCCPEAGGNP